jgi:hypothetical protein
MTGLGCWGVEGRRGRSEVSFAARAAVSHTDAGPSSARCVYSSGVCGVVEKQSEALPRSYFAA